MKSILMMVAKANETCRNTLIYDQAYYISVRLFVCYINVNVKNRLCILTRKKEVADQGR